MKTFILHLAACGLLSGLALAACATSANPDRKDGIAAFADDPRLGEEVSRICFNRNIDGFSNATRTTVVLEGRGREEFLVAVRGSCYNLRNAQSIGIDASTSCVTRGDILIVSESAFTLNEPMGPGPDRCMIDDIYKWNKDATDTPPDDSENDG